MKAEQRKELETNALADRMGHLMQRMRTQPGRATIYYVVGGILLLLAVFIVWCYFRSNQLAEAERWQLLNAGTGQFLDKLAAKDDAETNAGKAARFERAWHAYWDIGVKRLAIHNGIEGMKPINAAAAEYRKLADDCAGDKLWEPEALYCLAVIEETKAVINTDALDRAKKLYEDVRTKYPNSARGKLAAEWLTNAEDKQKYDKLKDFYQELHASLNIIDFEALNRQFRQHQDLLPPKKENKPAK